NMNGTQDVLGAAFRHQKKVVFSSTSEVYGRNPAVPFHEDSDRVLGTTQIDRWCYATSKAAGEHFCFVFARMGLPVVVLRYFNVYGPRLDRLDSGRVVTIFMGQLLRGEPLTVIGDGSQTRAFTYVADAVRATVEAGPARGPPRLVLRHHGPGPVGRGDPARAPAEFSPQDVAHESVPALRCPHAPVRDAPAGPPGRRRRAGAPSSDRRRGPRGRAPRLG